MDVGAAIPLVIGKSGANIRRLRKETGAKIDVEKDTTMLRITGTEAAVAKAWEQIETQLTDASYLETVEFSAEHDFTKAANALLCGENVSTIRTVSGAQVNVDHANREIQLVGKPGQRKKAKKAISQIFKKAIAAEAIASAAEAAAAAAADAKEAAAADARKAAADKAKHDEEERIQAAKRQQIAEEAQEAANRQPLEASGLAELAAEATVLRQQLRDMMYRSDQHEESARCNKINARLGQIQQRLGAATNYTPTFKWIRAGTLAANNNGDVHEILQVHEVSVPRNRGGVSALETKSLVVTRRLDGTAIQRSEDAAEMEAEGWHAAKQVELPPCLTKLSDITVTTRQEIYTLMIAQLRQRE
eukprot:COSAG06_NODE_9122_length_1981_cov_1.292242_1_plen_360_part_10